MKRKNNYLPSDDVQGQQCFDGLDITVRVGKSPAPEPIEPIKQPQMFKFIISDSELERLKKQYKYEMYCFYRDCDELVKHIQPIDVPSLANKDLTMFNKQVSKHLKKIKG